MNIVNNSFVLISKKLSTNDKEFINTDKYQQLDKMINDIDSNNFLSELHFILNEYFDSKLRL